MTTTTTTAEPDEASEIRESFALGQDGTRLYVRQRSGPSRVTAVLCDGICCDGFIYKYLWSDLARTLSVTHWHYRGHGRSAPPHDPEQLGVDAHVSDLGAVRDESGDPPVVLIGHSFGTQVCLEGYRARPDKIKALVLLCGSFGRVTHTFHDSEMLASLLPKLTAVADKHPKLVRAIWSRMPPKFALRFAMLSGEIDPKTINPEDVEPYFRHAANIDFPMFVKMLHAAGEHSAEDMLPSVEVPVLVIAGDHDSFTPPKLSERMAEELPHAELVMLPGGTHVAPLEHHELVALRIEKFLQNHGIV